MIEDPKQLNILRMSNIRSFHAAVLKLLCEKYLCSPTSPPSLPNAIHPTNVNNNHTGLAYISPTINATWLNSNINFILYSVFIVIPYDQYGLCFP